MEFCGAIVCGAFKFAPLPEAKATGESIGVCAKAAMLGHLAQFLGVAATQNDIVRFQALN